ncbi:MAG: hypothetical protein WCT08_06580 [Patescibacteria group bacterium]|jgi:hypothetical protein
MVLLGTINPNFQQLKDGNVGRYIGMTILRAFVSLMLVGLVQFYFVLPAMYWPKYLWVIFFPILWNCIITWIEIMDDNDTIVPAGVLTVILAILLVVSMVVGISPYTNTEANLRPLMNIKIADNLPSEQQDKLDLNHILSVPPEMASWKANKVISGGGKNYGAFFQVGTLELQKIQGRQMYAAPLIYNGFMAWWRSDGTPGFVLVDAEDPNLDARLVILDQPMKYLPEGNFGDNLERYLYNRGYSDYTQYEQVFEVNDSLRPYYVVTLTKFSSGFTGEVVEKVLLVDPITGSIQSFVPGTTPQWVDRAFPRALATQYAEWWGQYIHGWWNQFIGGSKDVLKPVGGVILVYGNSEHPDFFIQMTSHTENDQSLVGYFLFNSHLNEAMYYVIGAGTGKSYGHSASVETLVEAREEVTTPKFHTSFITYYPNLYGEPTWVVPIISPNHLVEKIAFVHAPNSQASNAVAIGNNKTEALSAYLELLARVRSESIGKVPTDQANLMVASGPVSRIGMVPLTDGIRYFIELNDMPNRIFQVPPGTTPGILAMTREKDIVRLQYLDTKEGVLSVQQFINTRYANLTVSPEQKTYDEQVTEQRGTEKDKAEYLELLKNQKRLDELRKKFGETVTPDK